MRDEGGRACPDLIEGMTSNLRRLHISIAAALFAAPLILYVVTLAPSVVTIFDDSLEFQLVTYRLGIAHPTGYPLYTLLGKLFTIVPIGNIAFRVNLMSAVFGAATAALTYLLIVRMGQKSQPNMPVWPDHAGGIMGALLLAVGVIFWQQATIAEVYTLNAFFLAALLLLVTRLKHSDNPSGIYWTALLAGISLTHHRTIMLLFPALALYLILVYGKRLFKPKTLLVSVIIFLAPLLLYLYLPLRGHIGSLDGTYQNTWSGFWRQVSAGGYGTSFLLDNPFGHERDFIFYWKLLTGQFYTLIPGLIGLIYLFRTQKKYLALTGVAFATYLAFNLSYNVTDIEVFFIPVFLIGAIWSGIGAVFLLRIAATAKFWTKDEGRTTNDESAPAKYSVVNFVLVTIVVVAFAFILLQQFQTGYAVLKQSYTWQVHDYGLDMLEQPPAAEDSAVVGILGEMTLLRYFQQTENRRPGIETVTADLETDRLAAVESLLAQGKTVYLTRPLSGASQRWSLNAVGPLVRVANEQNSQLPKNVTPLNQPVTPEITLAGYTISRAPHTGDGPAPVRLNLFWQVNQPIPADMKVSARLIDATGNAHATVDAVPVHFAYPTTAWRPGEIVSDVYTLALPVDTPSGQYTPLIIWYDPAQNATEVGRVELAPAGIE